MTFGSASIHISRTSPGWKRPFKTPCRLRLPKPTRRRVAGRLPWVAPAVPVKAVAALAAAETIRAAEEIKPAAVRVEADKMVVDRVAVVRAAPVADKRKVAKDKAARVVAVRVVAAGRADKRAAQRVAGNAPAVKAAAGPNRAERLREPRPRRVAVRLPAAQAARKPAAGPPHPRAAQRRRRRSSSSAPRQNCDWTSAGCRDRISIKASRRP